jgi:SAM-dependent methyltransferase
MSNPLRLELNNIGYGAWFSVHAAEDYFLNPWQAFRRVEGINPVGESRNLQDMVSLFIKRQEVSIDDLEFSIGRAALAWLWEQGIVESHLPGFVKARYCLLSCFGKYLLIQWPDESGRDQYTSSSTYLNSSTFDCIKGILRRTATGKTLDLGCGSGLVVLALSEISSDVFGLDIDTDAVTLARLNIELNDVAATVLLSDMTASLPPASQFDLVVVNPVWRIVPEDVIYPNATARRGQGIDGFDMIRRIFSVVPSILQPNGQAVLRFDVPLGVPDAEAVYTNPDSFTGPGFEADFEVLGTLSVEEQAFISANTCHNLNRMLSFAQLEGKFCAKYAALGVSKLLQVNCTIRRL